MFGRISATDTNWAQKIFNQFSMRRPNTWEVCLRVIDEALTNKPVNYANQTRNALKLLLLKQGLSEKFDQGLLNRAQRALDIFCNHPNRDDSNIVNVPNFLMMPGFSNSLNAYISVVFDLLEIIYKAAEIKPHLRQKARELLEPHYLDGALDIIDLNETSKLPSTTHGQRIELMRVFLDKHLKRYVERTIANSAGFFGKERIAGATNEVFSSLICGEKMIMDKDYVKELALPLREALLEIRLSEICVSREEFNAAAKEIAGQTLTDLDPRSKESCFALAYIKRAVFRHEVHFGLMKTFNEFFKQHPELMSLEDLHEAWIQANTPNKRPDFLDSPPTPAVEAKLG